MASGYASYIILTASRSSVVEQAQCNGRKPNSLNTDAPEGFLFKRSFRSSLFGFHLLEAKCNGRDFVEFGEAGPAAND